MSNFLWYCAGVLTPFVALVVVAVIEVVKNALSEHRG